MYNMSPTSTEGLGDCLRWEALDLSLLSWLTLRVWCFCNMSSGSDIGNCQYVNRSLWVSISQASKSPCWIEIMTDTGHQTITAERIPFLQWGQSSVYIFGLLGQHVLWQVFVVIIGAGGTLELGHKQMLISSYALLSLWLAFHKMLR